MQISVHDNGYSHHKCYTPTNEIIFRSKVKETDDLIKKENTHIIKYEGRFYEVGDGVDETNINLELDKTKNEFYKITTLTALGLLNGQDFKIVSNLPLNLYSKENKEKMEDYLSTKNDYIKVEVNKKEKLISIKQCVIFPQCLPAIYEERQNIKDSVVGILDIGGLTCQGLITKNTNMQDNSKFTENLGVLPLQNKIKRELNKVFNINLQDYQMEDVIKYGLPMDIQRSKEIIEEICFSHTKEIKKIIRLVGWDIDNILILLVGGGSLLLEEYLIKEFPYIQMSNDPVWVNVRGLWKVAKVVYNV